MLTLSRLSAHDAEILIKGAEAEALKLGQPMCIAVCDESGFLIAFRRMDGAKSLSALIAQEKARTAALVRKPTHELNQASQPGMPLFSFHTSGGGGITLLVGGMPVWVDGQVVGAIGVSSGPPDQDLQCAKAGLAAWEEADGSKGAVC